MTTHIEPPRLPAEFELAASGIPDINAVVEPLMALRTADPIIRATPAAEINAALSTTLPVTGSPMGEVLGQLAAPLEAWCRRNTHPGFFGYIASGGLPLDAMSSAMVAALNQNVVGYPGAPLAATIERTVIRWLCELAGLPAGADGMFLGGGSMANLTAIGAALSSRFGADYRQLGLSRAAKGANPVIICSAATHFSIQRAAGLLGLGTDQVIAVQVDDMFRMRIDCLQRALEQHDCVVAVIASAGTTTTGAVDPIDQVATLCRQYQCWLHVDAAYGAGALLDNGLRSLFSGIECADSITMDLHKWFFQAIDSSVILYRDPAAARQLFYERSDYIQFPPDGPPEQHMFFHLGPELSRRFRALPAYLAFLHYGTEKLGRNVLHNVECARYLAALVAANERLELVAAPQLSIVNFRYRSKSGSDATEDVLNDELRRLVEMEGHFLMSQTSLLGRPTLRVCIVNQATRYWHIDGLVARVLELGQSLEAEQ